MERTNEEVAQALVTAALCLVISGLAISAQKALSKAGIVPFRRHRHYASSAIRPIYNQAPRHIDVSTASPLITWDTLTCPRPVIRATRTYPSFSLPANAAEFVSPSATASAPPALPSFPIAIVIWLVAALVTAVLYTAYVVRKCSTEANFSDALVEVESRDSTRLQLSSIRTTSSAGDESHLDEQAQTIESQRHKIAALELRLEDQTLKHQSRLAAKDLQMKNLDEAVRAKDLQMKNLEEAVRAKDRKIQTLEEQLEIASSTRIGEAEIGSPTATGGDRAEVTGDVDVHHTPPSTDKTPHQQISQQPPAQSESTAHQQIIIGGKNNPTIARGASMHPSTDNNGGLLASRHAGGPMKSTYGGTSASRHAVECKWFMQGQCKFKAGDCRNGPHMSTGVPPVCRKYLEGDCHLSNMTCQYHHPEGAPPACKRFRKGLCLHKAEECAYAHVTGGVAPMCGFTSNGVCNRLKGGVQCPYSHPS